MQAKFYSNKPVFIHQIVMLPVGWHITVELSVCLCVRPKTLTFPITYAILKIAT